MAVIEDVMHERKVEDTLHLGVGVAAGELPDSAAYVIAPGGLGVGAVPRAHGLQQALVTLEAHDIRAVSDDDLLSVRSSHAIAS